MRFTPYKKELLFRKSQGKKRLGEFESKLRNLLAKEKSLVTQVSLEDTDRIIQTISSTDWTSCEEKTSTSTAEFFDFIETEMTPHGLYIFIDDDWEYCGAILARNIRKLNKQFDFNENHSDELRFISANLSTIASIDYIHNHHPTYFEYSIKRNQKT